MKMLGMAGRNITDNMVKMFGQENSRSGYECWSGTSTLVCQRTRAESEPGLGKIFSLPPAVGRAAPPCLSFCDGDRPEVKRSAGSAKVTPGTAEEVPQGLKPSHQFIFCQTCQNFSSHTNNITVEKCAINDSHC